MTAHHDIPLITPWKKKWIKVKINLDNGFGFMVKLGMVEKGSNANVVFSSPNNVPVVF